MVASPAAAPRPVLVVHGFGGTPSSVAPLAEGLRAGGHLVAAPALPGHGTTADDLAGRVWDDWTAAVETALVALAAEAQVPTSRLVVAGQSMGAALGCWLAARHDLAALVCVNPMVAPRDSDELAFLDSLLEAGEVDVPSSPDLADPDAVDPSYDRTPLAPLRSLAAGIAALQGDLPSVRCPVLVFTSTQDHVVDPSSSDHLAGAVTGPVERVRLERSFHSAVLDYDRDLIVARALAFVATLDRR